MKARAIFLFGRMGFVLLAMWSAIGLHAATNPVVSFGFRGTSGETVEVGEPLMIGVELRTAPGAKERLMLAPAQGAWTDAVNVELVSTANRGNSVRAVLLGRADSPRATLDATRRAGGGWLISEAAMKSVAPGDYELRVKLRVDSGDGWRGEVSAPSRKVKVVASKSNSVQRTLALAGEAMVADRLERAAQMLDEFLKTNPKEPRVWVLRATVAERAGNVGAALWFANQVVSSTGPVKGPPPLELVELRLRLRTQLEQPENAAAASPPAWSWPPRELVEATLAEAKKALPVEKVAPVAPSARPADPNPQSAKPATPATPARSAQAAASITAMATKPGAQTVGVLVAASELSEAKILSEPLGQWASAATAGSRYSNGVGYSPAQATGAPNVPKGSDNSNAWCHSGDSKEIEWLELAFATPVRATEVRVRQTLNPGVIIKLEAIEPDGTSHVWWEGRDAAGLANSPGAITWFAVRASQPEYLVARVRITLDLRLRVGWKQIDAVQLVGEP
ncbi:hypothetical protein [Oleiharenicola lentus]|uniref:tetratricopeptide repeat protein n=1 Tax=Oleiharenicola lentus TaxID=2508720 RepID=UPI003F66FB8B